MRKYISPEISVAKIQSQTLLAGSDPTAGFSDGEVGDGDARERSKPTFDW